MITVTFTPKNGRFTDVNLDGEPWRTVATSMLKGSKSLAASYSSLQVWTATWNEWEIKRLKSAAYYKLSKKRYFSSELRQDLLKLGFSHGAVDSILLEIGTYINDEEGIESLVRRGIRTGKGPQWIRYKLQEKGVDLPQNLEEYYPEEVRKTTILALINKNKKEKRKVIASLVRKGFSLDEIISVYRDIN